MFQSSMWAALLSLCVCLCGAARNPGLYKHAHITSSDKDAPAPAPGQKWALLVAGSRGYWNYRHQADVLHAYHLLKANGLHTKNIVLMVYNDIAYNEDNPYPGQIFNKPGGMNVYEGCAIDYSGDEVNSTTLLSVLEGNETDVQSLGTGKVIDSGPNDDVFLFFSDHGAPGVLGMPTGILYADQLLEAIKRKHASGGYKEMTLYIEACESGSLFQGVPELSELNLYVTTAANANESSWGTYCPGLHLEDDSLSFGNGSQPVIDTCQGDLFSVAWMEDSEAEDTQKETLRVQYDHVKLRTSDNNTFNMGSHVQRFGRVRGMEREHVANFIGSSGDPATPPTQAAYTNVAQRDADLVPLQFRAARASTKEAREAAKAQLDAALSARKRHDQNAEELAQRLLLHPDTSDLLVQNHGWVMEAVLSVAGRPHPHYVAQLVSGTPGRHPHQPLIDNWDCLREMAAAWEQVYGHFTDYSMRHTRLLSNLCNSGLNEQAVLAVARGLQQGRAQGSVHSQV